MAIEDALPERADRPRSAERCPQATADVVGFGDDWWRRGVVYQVYPRSFADSNGDGIGDLPGMIDHLDHLGGQPGSLGVDAIWLCPIYRSPGRDVGYDVADHTTIDPLYGTMADFDRLIEEAHRRGLRVMLDLVMNHTSDEHAWFRESRQDRANPRADWYIWRDPAGRDRRGRPRPPNNWSSFFGGSAWAWEPRREQFYLHTFFPFQPDLHWRSPAVRAAMLDMIQGWLDRGVDGFRLDVFNSFLKHPDLPDNPRRSIGRRAYSRQHHVHDKNHPELHELLAEIRDLVDARPGRMTVGELFDNRAEAAAEYARANHLVFDWRLMHAPWDADAVIAAIRASETDFVGDRWPAITLSNHDQPRHADRYRRGRDHDAIARAAALLSLTMRGTPFLYYGEEIALGDIEIPRARVVDPPAQRRFPANVLEPWWNRDQARAPMPWTDDAGAGFTTGDPWLPLPADAHRRNVAAQSADPDSVLSFYRRIIRLRREHVALQVGGLELLPGVPAGVVAYVRETADERFLVALNMAAREVTFKPPRPNGSAWQVLLGTHANRSAAAVGAAVSLLPTEGLLLVDGR